MIHMGRIHLALFAGQGASSALFLSIHLLFTILLINATPLHYDALRHALDP